MVFYCVSIKLASENTPDSYCRFTSFTTDYVLFVIFIIYSNHKTCHLTSHIPFLTFTESSSSFVVGRFLAKRYWPTEGAFWSYWSVWLSIKKRGRDTYVPYEEIAVGNNKSTFQSAVSLLKGAFVGENEQNAVAPRTFEFTESRSWSAGQRTGSETHHGLVALGEVHV